MGGCAAADFGAGAGGDREGDGVAATAECSSREECLLLANSEGDDLFGLVVAANEIRQRLVGDVISYVVTRNINFTNVCFVGCKFCAFSVGPRDETAYFLSLEEMEHKCREAEAVGRDRSLHSGRTAARICRHFIIATFCGR